MSETIKIEQTIIIKEFIEIYEDIERQIIEIDKRYDDYYENYHDDGSGCEDNDDDLEDLLDKIDISIKLYDDFYDKIVKCECPGIEFPKFMNFRNSIIETQNYINKNSINIELFNEVYSDIYKEYK